MNISEAKELISKFLDGRSSLEEEQILGDFLKESQNLPDELIPYKQMFTYFDEGMTDNRLLVGDGDEEIECRNDFKKLIRLKFSWAIAAVSAVAAIILVFYAVSFPDNLSSVRPNCVVLAKVAESSDSIDLKADSVRHREDNLQPHANCKLKKWRYKPAPVKPLLAEKCEEQITDSIIELSAHQVDDEIRKIEEQQQYVINLVKAVSIIHSAEIASVADDVDVY